MAGDPELAAVESALSALALAQTDGAFERAISRFTSGSVIRAGHQVSAAARAHHPGAAAHQRSRARHAGPEAPVCRRT